MNNTDLSHWDFADEFSAREAAALILGIEPSQCEYPDNYDRWKLVFNRMSRNYDDVWTYYVFEKKEDYQEQLRKAAYLYSEGIGFGVEDYARRDSLGEDDFKEWVNDGYAYIDNQTFTRKELARWLKATGLKSVYSFEPQTDSTGQSQQDNSPQVEQPTAQAKSQEATAPQERPASPPQPAAKELGTRERNSLLCIIGTMLELLLDDDEKYPSQAQLIKVMLANYEDKDGISKTSLESKFAEANRILKAD